MAYHRSRHGARGLNNSFLRRRTLLKRILQERAESASKTTQPSSTQALIIGPNGMANIQPIDEVTPSPGESAGAPEESGDSLSTQVNTQARESQRGVWSGENGQVALRQTESEEVAIQNSSPTLKPSPESVPPSQTFIATPLTTIHPSQSQSNNFGQAPVSSPVLSLVVSPISASLPPLLSTHSSTGATRSSTVSSGSNTSTADPVSTGVGDASTAPPLSQNPPIIVGILMVVLIVLAAVVALVSWLTRSARRRRKNRLEALTFKTDNSEEGLEKMDSHPFEETDMEEGMGHLDRARADREPVVPFYIEPHSTIFTHETYPADDDMHASLRARDGAYLPSLPPGNAASYQTPRNDLRVEGKVSHTGFRPTTRPKAPPGPWKHDRSFLSFDDSSVLQANTPTISEKEMASAQSSNGETRSLDRLQDPQPPNVGHGSTQPQTTAGLSWANALRSNLVSALDVVKHAASDRMLQGASTSKPPTDSQPMSAEDRLTPLPLRPGRESLGGLHQRRCTKEEHNLAFGGSGSRTGSKMTGSRSRERNGGQSEEEEEEEEEEELGAMRSRDRQSNAQTTVTIGGLGRFSFEQRMGNHRSQTLNTSFRNERNNGMAVHSTALTRRRSGMASGSGSSSHSTSSADLGADATMRKRRPNVV